MKHHSKFLSFAAKTVLTFALLTGARSVVTAAETNAPVVVIRTTLSPGVGTPYRGPQIIAALWSEGRMVWSTETNGGPPYQEGRFESAKLKALLDTLEAEGAFTNQALAQSHVAPDASFATISIDDGRRKLRMRSWHELVEQNGKLVVTVKGAESLAGRQREDVLREQPEEYRTFRKTWGEIRQSITALVPASGQPCEAPTLKLSHE